MSHHYHAEDDCSPERIFEIVRTRRNSGLRDSSLLVSIPRYGQKALRRRLAPSFSQVSRSSVARKNSHRSRSWR